MQISGFYTLFNTVVLSATINNPKIFCTTMLQYNTALVLVVIDNKKPIFRSAGLKAAELLHFKGD